MTEKNDKNTKPSDAEPSPTQDQPDQVEKSSTPPLFTDKSTAEQWMGAADTDDSENNEAEKTKPLAVQAQQQINISRRQMQQSTTVSARYTASEKTHIGINTTRSTNMQKADDETSPDITNTTNDITLEAATSVAGVAVSASAQRQQTTTTLSDTESVDIAVTSGDQQTTQQQAQISATVGNERNQFTASANINHNTSPDQQTTSKNLSVSGNASIGKTITIQVSGATESSAIEAEAMGDAFVDIQPDETQKTTQENAEIAVKYQSKNNKNQASVGTNYTGARDAQGNETIEGSMTATSQHTLLSDKLVIEGAGSYRHQKNTTAESDELVEGAVSGNTETDVMHITSSVRYQQKGFKSSANLDISRSHGSSQQNQTMALQSQVSGTAWKRLNITLGSVYNTQYATSILPDLTSHESASQTMNHDVLLHYNKQGQFNRSANYADVTIKHAHNSQSLSPDNQVTGTEQALLGISGQQAVSDKIRIRAGLTYATMMQYGDGTTGAEPFLGAPPSNPNQEGNYFQARAGTEWGKVRISADYTTIKGGIPMLAASNNPAPLESGTQTGLAITNRGKQYALTGSVRYHRSDAANDVLIGESGQQEQLNVKFESKKTFQFGESSLKWQSAAGYIQDYQENHGYLSDVQFGVNYQQKHTSFGLTGEYQRHTEGRNGMMLLNIAQKIGRDFAEIGVKFGARFQSQAPTNLHGGVTMQFNF